MFDCMIIVRCDGKKELVSIKFKLERTEWVRKWFVKYNTEHRVKSSPR